MYRYGAEQAVERLNAPERISADPVLPGFMLSLDPSWASGF